tara:strand:+ start:532 stop:822 length:291 start_codon:yes stop_codon:yes gene_type:complete
VNQIFSFFVAVAYGPHRTAKRAIPLVATGAARCIFFALVIYIQKKALANFYLILARLFTFSWVVPPRAKLSSIKQTSLSASVAGRITTELFAVSCV